VGHRHFVKSEYQALRRVSQTPIDLHCNCIIYPKMCNIHRLLPVENEAVPQEDEQRMPQGFTTRRLFLDRYRVRVTALHPHRVSSELSSPGSQPSLIISERSAAPPLEKLCNLSSRLSQSSHCPYLWGFSVTVPYR